MTKNKKTHNQVGQKFKEIRKRRGLTLKQLAEKLGRTFNYVTYKERSSEMKLSEIKDFSIVLDLSPNEVIEILVAAIPGAKHLEHLYKIPILPTSCGKFLDWRKGIFSKQTINKYRKNVSEDPLAFHVLAQGDSMTGRIDDKQNILEGDILLIEPGANINNHDICFCYHETLGGIVKRFIDYGDQVHLKPLNDKYKTIILNVGDPFMCFPIIEIIRGIKKRYDKTDSARNN